MYNLTGTGMGPQTEDPHEIKCTVSYSGHNQEPVVYA